MSESGFTGLAGFSGFRIARLALFDATINLAKPNVGKRFPVESARSENPENPIIP